MIEARAIGLQGIGYTPLLVAVQGFAPVPVTDRVNGGGGRHYSDEDIRRLVEEKWELIESDRRQQRAQETPVSYARPAPPVEKRPETEQTPPVLAVTDLLAGVIQKTPAPLLPDAAERARQARQRNDEEALILMLTELL